jgi:membrane protease YdiL (CAAX protease family)
MYSFSLPTADQHWPLLVLGLTTVVFLLFDTTCGAAQWRRRGYAELRAVVTQRLLGAALLGGVPALVVVFSGRSLWDFGLRWGAPASGAMLYGIVAGVVLPLSFLQSRRAAVWRDYPELRIARWSVGVTLLNAASWVLYLIGYELLFRGVLLFTLALWIGPWPAVGAMTAVYTLAHLGKPAGEAFGCIPMGIVFGWTALATGSVWPVIAAHSVIAVFNDWGAVRHDPARSFG